MPSRKIEDCCLELQTAWPKLHDAFKAKFPGWGMILTCTHRPVEEQWELYQKGRELVGDIWQIKNCGEIVTNVDGKRKLSNHNYYPARAFDVALISPEGRTVWDTYLPQWQALPGLVEALGLISGGSWKRLIDFPHVEIAPNELSRPI